MSRLITLLNGDSVRSHLVTSIRIIEASPKTEYSEYEYKDRVLVDYGTFISVINFDNIEQCKTYAFALTNLINEDKEPLTRKWPTPLVAKIAIIDLPAATWIADNWEDLLAGKYTSYKRSVNAGSLIDAFDWHLTPEPFNSDYWSRIHNRLCIHNPVQYTGM
jgi:hypothetical protein